MVRILENNPEDFLGNFKHNKIFHSASTLRADYISLCGAEFICIQSQI